jgi:hypothetical protein
MSRGLVTSWGESVGYGLNWWKRMVWNGDCDVSSSRMACVRWLLTERRFREKLRKLQVIKFDTWTATKWQPDAVDIWINNPIHLSYSLCGLVVRVLGYRSGGPGSIPGTTRKSSGSGTGSSQPREYNWGANREYGRRDPSRWPRSTLYPQSLRRQAAVARSV